MGNGIFLATAVVDGKPTLFQYTMRPDDPVVIVERYKPTKEDLVPRPVDMSTAFGHNLVIDPEPYLSKTIAREIERLGQEQWAKFLAEGGESRPVDWDEIVKSNVTKFLESPDAARRLVERVAEDAVVVKINPLNYPEPLRQHLLNTPHYVGNEFHTGGNEEFVFSQPLSESFAAKGDPDDQSE
jgi:hypothetical protein